MDERFREQVSRARARYQSHKWKLETGRVKSNHYLQDFNTNDFAHFAKSAYESPRGYSIRVNPRTNEKEVFVAGTRNVGDWYSNFSNALPLTRYSRGKRHSYQNHLNDIVKVTKADRVYGHSRGGAIVADLDIPNYKKVGLDSAMIIARNKNMLNYKQSQFFDNIIGYGGKRNISSPFSYRRDNFHYRYKTLKKYRSRR